MRKFTGNAALMALFSGLLTVIAVTRVNCILAWVCYIPLFVILQRQQGNKQNFKTGLIFGSIVSIILFYWMIPGAERFTGSSVIYGIAVFMVSSIFICLYFSLVTLLFGILKRSSANSITNAVLAASLFTVCEALLMAIAKNLPWFGFHSGMGLSGSLYFIQPAEYFGVHILTFMVVLVNYLLAGFLVQKRWAKLAIPVGLVVVHLLIGFSIVGLNFPVKGMKIKVALLAANIPPEMRWNESTGNQLAEELLGLNRTAATMQPHIALWSESAIPWTYRKDDDLVNEALKITRPGNITHILGINSDAGSNGVYNSAYCILPDGRVTGRYDKQVLLSFIEKPLADIIFPFLSGGGFVVQKSRYNKPLSTPYGKAGIIICNEATVPPAASNMVNMGAEFLLNLSNDGWFSNSYLVDVHFYNIRLRAVETHRDIAVNSNFGYSGLIKANGTIAMKQKSSSSFVDTVLVQRNTVTTLFSQVPLLFIYICLAAIAILTSLNFKKIKAA